MTDTSILLISIQLAVHHKYDCFFTRNEINVHSICTHLVIFVVELFLLFIYLFIYFNLAISIFIVHTLYFFFLDTSRVKRMKNAAIGVPMENFPTIHFKWALNVFLGKKKNGP